MDMELVGLNIALFIIGVLVSFPLTILAIASVGYMLYWASKTLKSVELQKVAEFPEHLPELLLMVFFPLGVWYIQPRVNDLVKVSAS